MFTTALAVPKFVIVVVDAAVLVVVVVVVLVVVVVVVVVHFDNVHPGSPRFLAATAPQNTCTHQHLHHDKKYDDGRQTDRNEDEQTSERTHGGWACCCC